MFVLVHVCCMHVYVWFCQMMEAGIAHIATQSSVPVGVVEIWRIRRLPASTKVRSVEARVCCTERRLCHKYPVCTVPAALTCTVADKTLVGGIASAVRDHLPLHSPEDG